MNTRFTKLMEELDERMTTHPNVCIVWKSYLQKKRERLESDMLQCENMLDDIMPHIDDIPLATLFIIGYMPSIVSGDNNA